MTVIKDRRGCAAISGHHSPQKACYVLRVRRHTHTIKVQLSLVWLLGPLLWLTIPYTAAHIAEQASGNLS